MYKFDERNDFTEEDKKRIQTIVTAFDEINLNFKLGGYTCKINPSTLVICERLQNKTYKEVLTELIGRLSRKYNCVSADDILRSVYKENNDSDYDIDVQTDKFEKYLSNLVDILMSDYITH